MNTNTRTTSTESTGAGSIYSSTGSRSVTRQSFGSRLLSNDGVTSRTSISERSASIYNSVGHVLDNLKDKEIVEEQRLRVDSDFSDEHGFGEMQDECRCNPCWCCSTSKELPTTYTDPSNRKKSSCHLTGNSKTLLVSTFLFLTITGAQYVAAIFANSVALKADCGSMLVDAISYIGNLMAECTQDKAAKKRLELTMSFISLVLLAVFTTLFILEAVDNVQGKGDDDDVNAWIVLAFALGGLLFDAATLYAYKYWGDSSSEDSKSEAANGNPEDFRHGGHKHEEIKNVNMLSALMHVFSDLLRSTTTLVESIVLFNYPDVNGSIVDGWCALIVCSLIAVGCLSALIVWLKEFFSFYNGSGDNNRMEGFDYDGDDRTTDTEKSLLGSDHLNTVAESPHFIGRRSGGMRYSLNEDTPVLHAANNTPQRRGEAEGRGTESVKARTKSGEYTALSDVNDIQPATHQGKKTAALKSALKNSKE